MAPVELQTPACGQDIKEDKNIQRIPLSGVILISFTTRDFYGEKIMMFFLSKWTQTGLVPLTVRCICFLLNGESICVSSGSLTGPLCHHSGQERTSTLSFPHQNLFEHQIFNHGLFRIFLTIQSLISTTPFKLEVSSIYETTCQCITPKSSKPIKMMCCGSQGSGFKE